MGKLAKPQRSKKHKKIKSIDPAYSGDRRDSRSQGLNQKPKNYEQELPKKLKALGFTIDGVRGGHVGKRSKNKFLKHADGPALYQGNFSTPLGATPSSKSSKSKSSGDTTTPKISKEKVDKTNKVKKGAKLKVSEEVLSDYVDNLKPVRPFVGPFTYKQKSGESEKQFNHRVNSQTNRALTKSKIDDHFDVSDEKKLQQKMVKVKRGMSDKKKQRLKEKKLKKVEAVKEKKIDKTQGFAALQDKVVFGEVVHAPPELSVRPKKALLSEEVDRPGRRMPELNAFIAANMKEKRELQDQGVAELKPSPHLKKRKLGTTLKRKDMSVLQQRQTDSKREEAIEAYRMFKKNKLISH